MEIENGSLVYAEIDHIVRDARHEYEKPYEMRYDTGGVIPWTNATAKPQSVTIRDFRPFQTSQSFQDYGFSIEKMELKITEVVFDNRASIKDVYYPVIETLLRQQFPAAKQLRVVEHNVSLQSWAMISIILIR